VATGATVGGITVPVGGVTVIGGSLAQGNPTRSTTRAINVAAAIGGGVAAAVTALVALAAVVAVGRRRRNSTAGGTDTGRRPASTPSATLTAAQPDSGVVAHSPQMTGAAVARPDGNEAAGGGAVETATTEVREGAAIWSAMTPLYMTACFCTRMPIALLHTYTSTHLHISS
jgi:hypothetical protein